MRGGGECRKSWSSGLDSVCIEDLARRTLDSSSGRYQISQLLSLYRLYVALDRKCMYINSTTRIAEHLSLKGDLRFFLQHPCSASGREQVKRQSADLRCGERKLRLRTHIQTPALPSIFLMNRPSRAAMTVMALLLSASICVFVVLSSVFADGQQTIQAPFLVDGKLDLIYEYSHSHRELYV